MSVTFRDADWGCGDSECSACYPGAYRPAEIVREVDSGNGYGYAIEPVEPTPEPQENKRHAEVMQELAHLADRLDKIGKLLEDLIAETRKNRPVNVYQYFPQPDPKPITITCSTPTTYL